MHHPCFCRCRRSRVESRRSKEDIAVQEQRGADMDALTQRALNEKHRKLASQWWDTMPLADLMTCRLVMEPLRELMKQHLGMSGTRWEDQQLHQAVADDIAGTDRQRQFRGAGDEVSSSRTLVAH